MTRLALLLVVLAACPKSGDKPTPNDPVGSGSQHAPIVVVHDAASGGAHVLPAAPPLPAAPISLPAPAANPRVTAEAVAFGELLFFDPRLSASGTRACATCHVPERGFAGGMDAAADGKPNARRTPALVNLAWVPAFGWDGRAQSITELLPAHLKGQLDLLEASAARIAAIPTYAAHIARVGGAPADALVQALEAYVLTRYEADAPWDVQERTASRSAANPIVEGYKLFTGKAQCAQCHTPPLYTDNAYHRVVRDSLGDKGRGLVDPAQAGAFRTPTLRGAIGRGAYFHDGSKPTVDSVIAYYQSPDAAAVNPALAKIKLSPDEAKHLTLFLGMLSLDSLAPSPRPVAQKPALP